MFELIFWREQDILTRNRLRGRLGRLSIVKWVKKGAKVTKLGRNYDFSGFVPQNLVLHVYVVMGVARDTG